MSIEILVKRRLDAFCLLKDDSWGLSMAIINLFTLQQYGVPLFEEKGYKPQNWLILNDIETFMQFVKQNHIQSIFYKYSYYAKEQYLASDELVKAFSLTSKELSTLKDWALTRNMNIESLDFGKPFSLLVFCLFESTPICYKETDEWISFDIAENDIRKFQEELTAEMVGYNDENDELCSLYEEFKNLLFADNDFRFCKNKYMRIEYINNFLSKGDNTRFLNLVRNHKAGWERQYYLGEMSHKLYEEYKIECKRNGLMVGEPLPSAKEIK